MYTTHPHVLLQQSLPATTFLHGTLSGNESLAPDSEREFRIAASCAQQRPELHNGHPPMCAQNRDGLMWACSVQAPNASHYLQGRGGAHVSP